MLFAANPKASMTSTILKETFQNMDKLGITQQGIDENGNTYCPAAVIDGYISWMGEDILRYVNDKETHWEANLGALYGTEYWQLHNNKRQNKAFKSEFALSKQRFNKKKWLAGLDPEILPCKIVIVIQDAIMKSFMNSQYSTVVLLHRGWNPYNRNLLNCVLIFVKAPEAVQKERNIVLWIHLITLRFYTMSCEYVPQVFYSKSTEFQFSELTFKAAVQSCLSTLASFSRWS